MSDALRGGREEKYYTFQSLQYSLFVTLFITVIGGGFFLFCSLYIAKDKADADAATKGMIHLHTLILVSCVEHTLTSYLGLSTLTVQW